MNAIVKCGSIFSFRRVRELNSRPIIIRYTLRERETRAPGAETQEGESIYGLERGAGEKKKKERWHRRVQNPLAGPDGGGERE